MLYVDTEFGKWLLNELDKRGWSQFVCLFCKSADTKKKLANRYCLFQICHLFDK